MVESIGRIFVAVGLPPEVRMAIAEHLARRPLPGAPVPAGNFHLTLRFLGETAAVGFDRLLAALDETPLPPPFPLELGGLGAFPQPRKATVLWLGVTAGGEAVENLHLAVDDACAEAGLGREERPFRPHLTVSRMRPPVDVRSLIEHTPQFNLRSRVDAIAVLRSHLGGGAPRYELLETFPL